MTGSRMASLAVSPHRDSRDAGMSGRAANQRAPDGTNPHVYRPSGKSITRGAALGAMAMICGAGLIGAGIGSVARETATADAYERLSQTTRLPRFAGEAMAEGEEGSEAPRHDWANLQAVNPATAAWLAVNGTTIDLPVVMARDEGEQDWYLSHDLWGQASASGTPFMDWRCKGAGTRHICVYAHHMTSTSGMFSQLQSIYEQERFDALGTLSWETPSGVTWAVPLCALRVDAGWQEIQRFDWDAAAVGESDTGFAAWLEDVAMQADALSSDAPALLRSPTRCFTLVTCSSDFARQRGRTLALWVC